MESLFSQVLSKVTDGQKIKFTTENVDKNDDFLILDDGEVCEVTLHTKRVPYWIEFDNEEPMRLEDVPESFLLSILKNI